MMRLSVSKKEIALFAICVVLLVTTIAARASAYAILYSNEYSKSTGCVGRGNYGFSYNGNTEASSHASVEYRMYGGSNSNSCDNFITQTDCARGNSFGPLDVESSYSVGKVIMYGNNHEYPQKYCIASCSISSCSN